MDQLSYTAHKMDPLSVEMVLSVNGVTFEKCQIYSDFTLLFIQDYFKLYPGDDAMDKESKTNYIMWVFNRVKTKFARYNLSPSKEFMLFMKEFIFDIDDNVHAKDVMTVFFTNLFNHRYPKSMADMECLLAIYKIFESRTKQTSQG